MSHTDNGTGNGTAKSAVQERLEDLRREYEAGEAKMKELERQQAYVRDTMLRISGAIQVLEELLSEAPASLTTSDDAVTPTSPTIGGDSAGFALASASEA